MRLFAAVWPPADVVSAISALPRPEVEGLRWTQPEQWHATLRFFGSCPDPQPVFGALAAGLDGGAELDPVVARLGPATARFGDRILHVPVGGLDGVAAVVMTATAAVVAPAEDQPFRGHITLARPRGRRRLDLRPLTGAPLVATWQVDEVTLVASTTAPAGARYEVVGRVPLAGLGPAHVPGEVP